MVLIPCAQCGHKKQANKLSPFKCRNCGFINRIHAGKKLGPTTDHKAEVKELGELWAKIIKARAGNVSEYSGKEKSLHAHHLAGKSNYALRFSLLNGYCCTAGEHFYGFHNQGDRSKYEDMVRKQRGVDVFDKLSAIRRIKSNGMSLMGSRMLLEKAAVKWGVN